MMRACVRDTSSGAVDNFLKMTEISKPTISSGYLLIKVHAAALNPVDYKWPGFLLNGRPLAYDVAGEVVEVNSGSSFKVGDKVFGNAKECIAEYCLLYEECAALKPDRLSWNEAAALPLAYLTVLQALSDYGGKVENNRILIIGASGGCGVAGVQLAKSLGAKEIVGVCSGKNVDFVKSLGATNVVDYTKETALEKFGKGYFDVVLDCASASGAGENYFESSFKSLKPNTGMNISLNGPPTTWIRKFLFLEVHNFHLVILNQTKSWGTYERIAELLEKEDAHIPIHKAFDFTEKGCAEAYELLKSRRAKGKVVINMNII